MSSSQDLRQDLRQDVSHLNNDCLQHSWPPLAPANTQFAVSLCGCPRSTIASDDAAASMAQQTDPLARSVDVDLQGLSDGHLGVSDFSNTVSETDGGAFDALDAENLGLHCSHSPEMMVDLDFCDLTEEPQEETAKSTRASVHSVSVAVQDDDRASKEPDLHTASTASGCNGDAIAFLLVTVADMSHELAALNHEHHDTWDSCDISLVNDELFSRRHGAGQGSETTHSPLKQVLDVSTRFVWALQTMEPVASFGRSHPGILPPLPVTLAIFSAYIQLVQLLNRLLACAVGAAHTGPERPQEHGSNSSRPGSSRGQKPHQQAIMVTRVIEHQLSSLERLIGVPREYRLWSSADSEAGVLGHDQSSKVTRAIIEQAQESLASLKQKTDKSAFGAF
ncbi:hypothetical protein V2A60_000864 [Cordyceps javanica]|uniref:Uncharacterized protein n=1 Tax=Cordyceps javanica TaxID=43265 RepID=A0A545VZG8_9HYPO|nr:hypothetical protein IF1G_05507 [Cordyceps javanica]TQW07118.1 hypothetical protein IF2G_05502 [Cordyceps javanica]